VALGSDPYAVLEVHRDASDSQIAQARRRLSREYHPDVNSAPDAAARFAEVQQAFDLLSDPAARAEYDRTHGEPGRARIVRDPGGGYGVATEASPGIFIQPTSVDFGLLTPRRPSADAKVTVAWTGARPSNVTSDRGSEWWASLAAEMPASSCIVFYLRAQPHAGAPNGRQRAQFTVTLDDTALTVQLSAEIQGEFPPRSQPDFESPAQPDFGWPRPAPAIPPQIRIGIAILLAVLILLSLLLH
jgi:curved DNA-binding protein CbpA